MLKRAGFGLFIFLLYICFIILKKMGKYLKQAFVMDLERQLSRGEITHSFMVDLMQEECIKNYIAETSNTEKNENYTL